MGKTLETLKAHLSIHPNTRYIAMTLEDKISSVHEPTPTQRFVRYPNVYSPNAHSVVKSLVPALAMKCNYYQTGWDSLRRSCIQTITELHNKGYPGKWWGSKQVLGKWWGSKQVFYGLDFPNRQHHSSTPGSSTGVITPPPPPPDGVQLAKLGALSGEGMSHAKPPQIVAYLCPLKTANCLPSPRPPRV